MNLLKSIYTDSLGNIWEIEKYTLTNKRGKEVVFWRGYCDSIRKSYSGSKKYMVMGQIRLYNQDKLGNNNNELNQLELFKS